MNCNWYSQKQLEDEAEKLLQRFNPALLISPQEYDVYGVIEKCLEVDYGWQYIRPDQKILGPTAFNEGDYWVSPTPYFYEGIKPKLLHLKKGEIVIDTTLTEENNRGRENFTVMHEVFHQVIHKEYFENMPGDCVHKTTTSVLSRNECKMRSQLDFVEYQANACAAAFIDDFRRFQYVLPVDCSLYKDAPLAVQVTNIYRSRAIGSYYQRNGCNVYPFARWSNEYTYTTKYFPEKIAFLGLPKHSIICIGTYGCINSCEEKQCFKEGLKAMLETLLPQVVLVYGAMPTDIFGDYLQCAEFIQFPDWITRMHGGDC